MDGNVQLRQKGLPNWSSSCLGIHQDRVSYDQKTIYIRRGNFDVRICLGFHQQGEKAYFKRVHPFLSARTAQQAAINCNEHNQVQEI